MSDTLQAQAPKPLPQFSDEVDMYGNQLHTGCEVLFAIGSKIRNGTVIRPAMVTVTEKQTIENGTEEGAEIDVEKTVPGILIYNDESVNRKMVTRPCEDVCLLG